MSKEKESLSTKENKKPKTKRTISKKVTVGGLILSIICFCVAIWLLSGAYSISSDNSSFSINYGLSLTSIFIFTPVLIIFAIAICYNAVTFRRHYEEEKTSPIMIAELGLALSIISALSIPVFCMVAANKAAEYDARVEAKHLQEEEAKKAHEDTPAIIYQMSPYDIRDCYSYDGSLNYMVARDAICSYLRYTYSSGWQEPETIDQFLSSEYTPEYFAKSMIHESSGQDPKQYSSITIKSPEDDLSTISRTSLNLDSSTFRTRFIITPHRTCSRDQSDSAISIWYLDNNNYGESSEKDFVCMSFSNDIDEQESIYSANFEARYKELLGDAYNNYNRSRQLYDFTIPFTGIDVNYYLYNPTTFLDNFFSGWPNI